MWPSQKESFLPICIFLSKCSEREDIVFGYHLKNASQSGFPQKINASSEMFIALWLQESISSAITESIEMCAQDFHTAKKTQFHFVFKTSKHFSLVNSIAHKVPSGMTFHIKTSAEEVMCNIALRHSVIKQYIFVWLILFFYHCCSCWWNVNCITEKVFTKCSE